MEYACHRLDHSLPGSGLFSLVVLMAHALHPDHLPTRQAAWYPKAEPTFVDALASVHRHLWAQLNSPTRLLPWGLSIRQRSYLTRSLKLPKLAKVESVLAAIRYKCSLKRSSILLMASSCMERST